MSVRVSGGTPAAFVLPGNTSLSPCAYARTCTAIVTVTMSLALALATVGRAAGSLAVAAAADGDGCVDAGAADVVNPSRRWMDDGGRAP